MDKATPTPSTAPTEKIWECKIGGISDTPTPSWSDGPMRQAVEAAFEKVTGKTPAFLFSGWGASLTEPERAVVENRLPNRAEVERLAAQAAPSSAIIASLCGDVEPVAFMFQHGETGRILVIDPWQKANGWQAGNPRFNEMGAAYSASTVAALKAERDAALARATDWQRLYDRAINEANGLTNYVEDRPELRSAERRLDVISADARVLKGQP